LSYINQRWIALGESLQKKEVEQKTQEGIESLDIFEIDAYQNQEMETELQEGNKYRLSKMEIEKEDMRREVARIGGRFQDAQQEFERLAKYSRSLEQIV
jgi:hypothetical protein